MIPTGFKYPQRVQRLKELLKRLDLGAFVVTNLTNVRYLCGFTGTDGILAITPDSSGFLTDSRYTEQARIQVSAEQKIEYRVKQEGLLDFLRDRRVTRVGFEAETLPYGTVEKWKDASKEFTAWIPVGEDLIPLRGQKETPELLALEEATRINFQAFEEVLPLLKPGVRERDFSLELEIAIRRLGGEEKAFDFIVASGKRGALPHGVASDKVVQAGEMVTVDFGCRYAGYHSDETVTVAVGSIGPKETEVFEVVYKAQQKAMSAIRPGASLKEIDGISRQFIQDAGFGEYFGHGLGHGVGLEVHEFPTLNPRTKDIAEEGMVFTIEPGIYIPEFGGVRIEDMVVVTGDGFRRLTRLPKQLRHLPE